MTLGGRQRKVKCSLATENSSACSQCIKFGLDCVNDGPEPESWAGKSRAGSIPDQHAMQDRLERMEAMLKRLVHGQDAKSTIETQFSRSAQAHAPDDADADEPIHSLPFTWNGVAAPSASATIPSLKTLPQGVSRIDSKFASEKQFLTNLLPAQQDVTNILNNTMAWVLELKTPPGVTVRPMRRIAHWTMDIVAHFPPRSMRKNYK
ncbi:hypothetical protein GQ53DRAFT_764463 [Thozetella sp. PMI_491]|nr:hypothetical protein GQ53DRAFT_764463 [Thozetella sp. PMI_491]